MLGWAIAVGILLAIGLIRVGVRCEYSAEGFALWLRIGSLRVQVLPAKPKTPQQLEEEKKKKAEKDAIKAAKKAEKKAAKAAEKEAKAKARQAAIAAGEPVPSEWDEKRRKIGGAVDLVAAALPTAFDAVGTFFARLTVDELTVWYTSAGDDPFDAVMGYGYVSAGMGVITPLLDKLKVKNRDLRSGIDMTLDKPVIYIKAGLHLRIWEGLYIVLRFAVKFVSRYISRKQRSRRKAAERI